MTNETHLTDETNVLLYENATGSVPYGLKNDYMFHVVFQQNMVALSGLISSVLHIPEKSITEIQVQNPIELGKSIDDKTFLLDLKVIINNRTIINLELQINNEHNWPERSLGYLCRSYDNLNSGDDYLQTKPAIHISFLDFTLFTSNFSLIVVELNNTKLATQEYRQYGIDKWARLFNSKSWEDLKMCADEDKAMLEALKELYKYNAEEQIREQCEARERYYVRKRYLENKISTLSAEIETMNKQLEAKDKKIASLLEQISKMTSE